MSKGPKDSDYSVCVREGAPDRFRWVCYGPMAQDIADRIARRSEAKGEAAMLFRTADLEAVGAPTDYNVSASHAYGQAVELPGGGGWRSHKTEESQPAT